VFVDGRLVKTLRGETIVQDFIGMLNEYVERTYPKHETGVVV
jgi:hypothetical protein